MVRRLLPVLFVALLALALAACGQSRRTGKPAASYKPSYMNTPQARLGDATPAQAAAARHALLEKVAWVRSSRQPPLRNDGDNDEPGDEDHDNSHDTGTGPGATDPYVDYLPPSNNRAYHDEDDQSTVEFGHPASARDTQTIAAVVKRYYAAAAAQDGAAACSLMTPQFAEGVPIDYGRMGASYLHGGKTCAAVLSLLFKHMHGQLTEAVRVTDVRVNGSTALAFFGSRTMRASVITLNRMSGSWGLVQITGSPLL